MKKFYTTLTLMFIMIGCSSAPRIVVGQPYKTEEEKTYWGPVKAPKFSDKNNAPARGIARLSEQPEKAYDLPKLRPLFKKCLTQGSATFYKETPGLFFSCSDGDLLMAIKKYAEEGLIGHSIELYVEPRSNDVQNEYAYAHYWFANHGRCTYMENDVDVLTENGIKKVGDHGERTLVLSSEKGAKIEQVKSPAELIKNGYSYSNGWYSGQGKNNWYKHVSYGCLLHIGGKIDLDKIDAADDLLDYLDIPKRLKAILEKEKLEEKKVK